jgi:GTP pyrophosphokinase
MSDNREFLDLIKTDLNLFTEKVYCFTPQGDVKTLPMGSTTVDFAYLIHSAVGNKMVGARVNGVQVPIEYRLQTGDRVEIITSQNSKGPSRDWLSFVQSSQAKNKINQWFKNEYKEENITRGRDLMEKYAKSKGLNLSLYMKPEYQNSCIRKYGLKTWDAVLAAIGHGGLKEGQVVNKLVEEYQKDHQASKTDEDIIDEIGNQQFTHKHSKSTAHSGITVKGVDDVSVRFSKCCSPVPGDEIIGFITRGRGISIHRTDCSNILSMPQNERTRLIEAEWAPEAIKMNGERYLTELCLYVHNRRGILLDITKIFMEMKLDINSLGTRVSKQGLASIYLSFETSGREELDTIMNKLHSIEGIVDIERTSG